MHKTRSRDERYAPRVLEAERQGESAGESGPKAGRIRAAAKLCSLIFAALAVCCIAVPLRAQRGGARGGGGFSGGAHIGGGFHGGSGFGGGFRAGGPPAGGYNHGSAANPAYRGYAPGVRPGVSAPRYGAMNGLRSPNGFRVPGYGARGLGIPGPSHTLASRPAFLNRGSAYRPGGYGYGYGYGRSYRPYRYPYRGYGYPFFPYFGVSYSPFLPGFLSWDLNWDTLGWDSPGFDSTLSYSSGYDPGYGSSGYTGAGYDPGAGASSYAQAAPRQQAYGDEAPPAADSASRPTPLLPQMAAPQDEPQRSALSREQLTTLIFKDGRPPEQIRNYAMTRSAVLVTGDQLREIPLDELDLAATEQVNRQAGVNFRVP